MVGLRVLLIAVIAATLGSACTGDDDDATAGRRRRASVAQACRPSPDSPCVVVHQEDFGDDWPFSVRSGLLACSDGEVVTFTIDSQTFGLTSRAGFPPPFEIWHWDNAEARDLHKSLKPLIEHARKFC